MFLLLVASHSEPKVLPYPAVSKPFADEVFSNDRRRQVSPRAVIHVHAACSTAPGLRCSCISSQRHHDISVAVIGREEGRRLTILNVDG